jgi:Leucine-rich repeat (LRR) protein
MSTETAAYLIEEARTIGSVQLDLGGLGLTEWPAGLHELTHLTHLTLRGNELASLPAEIGRLIHLTHLSLADNRLHALPPTIGQLRQLTHLNLRHNKLEALPPEMMRLTKLEMLQLQGNPLPLPADLLAKWDRPAEILAAYRAYLNTLAAEPTPQVATDTRLEWLVAQRFTAEEFAAFCREISAPDELAQPEFMDTVRAILAFHEQHGLGDELLKLLHIWLNLKQTG